MENLKTTLFCTGSGMLGGTIKGSLATVAGSISFDSMVEVVAYASLSALAAYLTKLVLDRFIHLKSNR